MSLGEGVKGSAGRTSVRGRWPSSTYPTSGIDDQPVLGHRYVDSTPSPTLPIKMAPGVLGGRPGECHGHMCSPRVIRTDRHLGRPSAITTNAPRGHERTRKKNKISFIFFLTKNKRKKNPSHGQNGCRRESAMVGPVVDQSGSPEGNSYDHGIPHGDRQGPPEPFLWVTSGRVWSPHMGARRPVGHRPTTGWSTPGIDPGPRSPRATPSPLFPVT